MTESGTISLVFELLDRGFTDAKIDRAMKKIIGADWREIHAAVWLERLKERGYLSRDTKEISPDDLEALVKASIDLERY